jgi:hypothetical protein
MRLRTMVATAVVGALLIGGSAAPAVARTAT